MPSKVSLQPEGMDSLSSIGNTAPQKISKEVNIGKNQTQWMDKDDLTKKQEEDLKKALSRKVSVNYELEQDNMEGVDASEWDE